MEVRSLEGRQLRPREYLQSARVDLARGIWTYCKDKRLRLRTGRTDGLLRLGCPCAGGPSSWNHIIPTEEVKGGPASEGRLIMGLPAIRWEALDWAYYKDEYIGIRTERLRLTGFCKWNGMSRRKKTSGEAIGT